MTSGTARAEEAAARPIRPERIEQIDAVIATLQAQGAPVTNAVVYEAVKGHRADVVGYLKQWRQQQREASPLAPASPPTPPMSRLLYLRGQVAHLDEQWDAMQRVQRQLAEQRAQAHADLRNAILDASRLTRRLRQADAQALSPAYLMQPDAAPQRTQMVQELTALVGAAGGGGGARGPPVSVLVVRGVTGSLPPRRRDIDDDVRTRTHCPV